MQTYTPFNWNTCNTTNMPFGGFNPWSYAGLMPQAWNNFPGYQNFPTSYNTTPWFGYSPINSWYQNWNRSFAQTPWQPSYQPWNTLNTCETFQPWSNLTPTWNMPFTPSWFQPTTNWFNGVPFGFYPGANFSQPFAGGNVPGSYPFAGYNSGNYPFTQSMPTNGPVYPTGQVCRDAA